ncbi:MAG: DUF4349 domain-containing protein [Dehalococcoidia bacterium]|nr:DUF4349 domain-containing protein [Dehalococcoidia bacterium]
MHTSVRRLGRFMVVAAIMLSAACSAASPSIGGEPGGPVGSLQDGVTSAVERDRAAQAPLLSQGTPSGVPAKGGDSAAAPAPTDDRMIMYTTQISLDVDSVTGSVAAVTGLAEGLGGYVSQNTLRAQGDKDFATMVIRVPAKAYNQAMDQLRKLGVKVTAENGSTRDVTEEFADLGAQAKNLEASEAQLQALMIQAKTVDEILKVQNQLSQVRGQIERLKGRINVLQRTSDMATVTISLSPVIPGKPESPKGWDPLRSIQESWETSTQALVRVLDAGLRVTVMSWWVLLLGIAGLGAAASWRRGRAKPPVAVSGGAS